MDQTVLSQGLGNEPLEEGIGMIRGLLASERKSLGAAAPNQKEGCGEADVRGRQTFIMLSGELHNSSASRVEYMKPIWTKLVAMHLARPSPPRACYRAALLVDRIASSVAANRDPGVRSLTGPKPSPAANLYACAPWNERRQTVRLFSGNNPCNTD